MFIKQFFLNCLSHASYVIGDERAGVAAVVDPQRDIDQYIEEAQQRNLRITHVFLTHFHADFVAGHLELHERTGAAIYLGRAASAEFDFVPLTEGQRIELGDVRLQILETPGHTTEGICIVVYPDEHAAQPHAVLTGDTLFVGDVGRPDLMASVGISAEELAGQLYDSLHKKLLPLPDETIVYPAHGAGSMCGKNLGSATASTIGEQKLSNYALKPMQRESFVKLVASDLPSAPAYFSYDATMNRSRRAVLGESMSMSMTPLRLDDVIRLKNIGAQIVDVRAAADYAAHHLPSSLNIGLQGKFATWAGTILNHDRHIVIVADEGAQGEAITRLGRIGFDKVSGYLQDAEWLENESLAKRTNRLVPSEILAKNGQFVLDVRAQSEWDLGHVPGSTNIPLPELAARANELPRDVDIVVMCASGYRSSIAIGILEQHGFERLSDAIGGFTGWSAYQSELSVQA